MIESITKQIEELENVRPENSAGSHRGIDRLKQIRSDLAEDYRRILSKLICDCHDRIREAGKLADKKKHKERLAAYEEEYERLTNYLI